MPNIRGISGNRNPYGAFDRNRGCYVRTDSNFSPNVTETQNLDNRFNSVGWHGESLNYLQEFSAEYTMELDEQGKLIPETDVQGIKSYKQKRNNAYRDGAKVTTLNFTSKLWFRKF